MNTNENTQNGKERDILEQNYLRENPYTLPQNYFAKVEDSVREKIKGEAKAPKGIRLADAVKTCTAFAAVFAIVFGLGYGAMYFTGTAKKQQPNELYSQTEPSVPANTLEDADINYIEQYLIESNVSIATLASLE